MLAEALLGCYRKSLEEGGEVFQLKTFICGRSRIENKAGIALAEFFRVCFSETCYLSLVLNEYTLIKSL